ncbi:MAG: Ldh family oxidoreductase [Pseudolysinimonas sp.]|uniref:Ldh family oxidoreductase n=1 Tax=Pseudolysinimonas sp. TaxID=2680009 RepID=UPI003C721E1C
MTVSRVSDLVLREFLAAALQALGLSRADATTVAGAMAFADRRGIASHGLALLPYYAGLIERGVNPLGRPVISRDQGSVLVIDGGNSLGHVAADFAVAAAIDRAASTGVGVAAIGGSSHCGAMSAYATRALERGMIGFATTNAMPTMAPSGGMSRIVGMNPLAVAIPAGEEEAFVLDASLAAAARGKIVVRAQEGEALPPGWALDVKGRPTTDPAAALAGLLVPIGGPKGVGLAMVMGILSSLLSGAAYGTELGSLESGPEPGRDGHFMMVLDIAAFTDRDAFGNRMDSVIRQIRACPPADGAQVRVPGDRAREAEEAAIKGGIPIPDSTLANADALAERLGLDPVIREVAA